MRSVETNCIVNCGHETLGLWHRICRMIKKKKLIWADTQSITGSGYISQSISKYKMDLLNLQFVFVRAKISREYVHLEKKNLH